MDRAHSTSASAHTGKSPELLALLGIKLRLRQKVTQGKSVSYKNPPQSGPLGARRAKVLATEGVPDRNDPGAVGDEVSRRDVTRLVFVTPHVEGELHRALGAELFTRTVLRQEERQE